MTSRAADPVVGQVIDGRYRIIEHLADGGMASVWVAMDARLDREVALKLMRPGLATDAVFVERFRAEAKASARLSHPNVVAVYDQGTDHGSVFLAMELVRGKTLRDVIDDEAPFTPREALAILEPILLALRAAHTAGIVHRDVKPENVIIRTDGEVKVADFGLARAIDANTTNMSGMLLGTASYLAPEQVEHGNADARSDVYAAGLLLFEMLTGIKAVRGSSPIQIAYAHVHGAIPPPSSMASGVPADLDRVVARATARQPGQRYSSCAEYLAALRGVRRALTRTQLDRRPVLLGSVVTGEAAPSESRTGPRTRLVPVSGPDRTATEHTRVLPGQPSASQASPQTPDAGGTRQDTRPLSGLRMVSPAAPHTDHDAARASGEHHSGAPEATHDPSRYASATVREGSPANEPEHTRALPKTRTRRSASWLVSAVLALLIIAAGGSGWWFTRGPGSMTLAPTATNMAATSAVKVIEEAQLDAKVVEQFSETVATGSVISTDPVAGTEVRKGSRMTVLVSKGLERFTVPNLIHTPGADAARVLAEQNLKLVNRPEEYSETVPKGSVISQDPQPNTKAKRDATVSVTVSKGRTPITVPTLVGRPLASAERAATAVGLKVTTSGEANSDSVPKGSVISQKPDRGTLFAGETISVLVSKGPVMVTVPDVVGKTESQARAALSQAGLTARFSYPLGSSLLDLSRSQSVRAGTQVPKGSTVTVTVV